MAKVSAFLFLSSFILKILKDFFFKPNLQPHSAYLPLKNFFSTAFYSNPLRLRGGKSKAIYGNVKFYLKNLEDFFLATILYLSIASKEHFFVTLLTVTPSFKGMQK